MMDHEQAVETQAPTRYALGEMSPAERDSFEEHFADCSQCMGEALSASAFAANAKEVFRRPEAPGSRDRGRLAWLPWRPVPVLAFSAALNVLLIAGIGIVLLRVQTAAPGGSVKLEAQAVQIVPVRAAVRSSEAPQVVRSSGRPLVLAFDLPREYEHYHYSVEHQGSTVLSGELTKVGPSDTLNLQIPAGLLAPGEYRVSATATTGDAREDLGTCLLQVVSQ